MAHNVTSYFEKEKKKNKQILCDLYKNTFYFMSICKNSTSVIKLPSSQHDASKEKAEVIELENPSKV